jgi:four helix bundle protein
MFMGGITCFEDLDAWKEARILTKTVYNLTSKERFRRDFGLKDQIQRASVSIMANIAEGFDSRSDRSFALFLKYAYRSASEVASLLYVALDQSYVDTTVFKSVMSQSNKTKALIGGLIKYLKKTD